jgi:hypothetical protein
MLSPGTRNILRTWVLTSSRASRRSFSKSSSFRRAHPLFTGPSGGRCCAGFHTASSTPSSVKRQWSKLGRFVVQEGFSWPTNQLAASRDFSVADETLLRRLREADLVRPGATAIEVAETFRAARSEHAGHGCSPFNSPNERVRVFLEPYLTRMGARVGRTSQVSRSPYDDSGRGF